MLCPDFLSDPCLSSYDSLIWNEALKNSVWCMRVKALEFSFWLCLVGRQVEPLLGPEDKLNEGGGHDASRYDNKKNR